MLEISPYPFVEHLAGKPAALVGVQYFGFPMHMHSLTKDFGIEVRLVCPNMIGV